MKLVLADTISIASGAHNEDRAGLTGHAAWVLDGATDVLAQRILPGPSDAAWYAQTLSDAIARDLLAQDDAPPPQPTHPPANALEHPDNASAGPLLATLQRATASVARAFDATALRVPANGHEKPSAAGILATIAPDGRLTAVGLGDCTLLHLSAHGGARDLLRCEEAPREADAEVRDAVSRLRAERPNAPQHGPAGIRADLMPMLRAARARMNQPGGYGIFSLDLPSSEQFDAVTARVQPGDRLLLATDGFMRLVDLFGLYTVTSLGEALRNRGLLALMQELRAAEADDREGHAFARAKSRDDATAMLVEVVAPQSP